MRSDRAWHASSPRVSTPRGGRGDGGSLLAPGSPSGPGLPTPKGQWPSLGSDSPVTVAGPRRNRTGLPPLPSRVARSFDHVRSGGKTPGRLLTKWKVTGQAFRHGKRRAVDRPGGRGRTAGRPAGRPGAIGPPGGGAVVVRRLPGADRPAPALLDLLPRQRVAVRRGGCGAAAPVGRRHGVPADHRGVGQRPAPRTDAEAHVDLAGAVLRRPGAGRRGGVRPRSARGHGRGRRGARGGAGLHQPLVDADLRRRAAGRAVTAVVPRFDAVIHPPPRLQICGLLALVDTMEFAAVRDEVGVSDSVLSKHVKQLEEAGYVKVRKATIASRGRPSLSLTAAGRAAFDAHVAELRRITGG